MKIEITPQTEIAFNVISHKDNTIYEQYFENLYEARTYADWCENNGRTNIKLELIAES